MGLFSGDMLFWLFISSVRALIDPCRLNVPSSLLFMEPLASALLPQDIVLFSGGHSLERRTTGFGSITSQHLQRFAKHHGYNLAFLDELEYSRSLLVHNITFAPNWHRVFAFHSLIERFPEAKYLVWLDDDILVPYHETDMLNHYINLMESDEDVQLLIGTDIGGREMNTGMFFAKNTQFTAWTMDALLAVGMENEGHLARFHYHEQEALTLLRRTHQLTTEIKIIPHRDRLYNFNTFAGRAGNLARYTDAFIHYLDMSPENRMQQMKNMVERVGTWRASVLNCTFPISQLS